jgi:hypothetical protein
MIGGAWRVQKLHFEEEDDVCQRQGFRFPGYTDTYIRQGHWERLVASRWGMQIKKIQTEISFSQNTTMYSTILQYISNKMQRYTVYFIWKLLYMFRAVLPPIIRSAYTCIYSIWYLLHRYCYLPLSWKSWNWFECAVGGVHHPQHTQRTLKYYICAKQPNSVVRHFYMKIK